MSNVQGQENHHNIKAMSMINSIKMIPYANEKKEEILNENAAYEYELQAKKIKWYHSVLLNRTLRVTIALILVAILTPVLLYHYIFIMTSERPPSDGYSSGSCVVLRSARLLCGLGFVPQNECHPQCCYDLNNNMCFQRYPSRFSYIFNQNWSEDIVLMPRIETVPYKFQESFKTIRLSIDEISATHMSLTFYDSRTKSLNGNRIEEKMYSYEVLPPEMDITINGPQGRIFSTLKGPLIASDNIWEIAFRLTNETIYGLGELPLEEGTVKMIYNHNGGLNSVPLIYAKLNGSYHGLLIEATAPTEISINGENNIVVRSITSDGLKFHVFVGPEPTHVMRDVTKLIGSYEQLEYWMLGAHICNEINETPQESFEDLSEFIASASREKVPYESHCGTAPIVYKNEVFPETDTYIDEGGELVKSANKKFVGHVSPHILYGEHNFTESEDVETALTVRSNETCVDMARDFSEFMIRKPNSSEIYKGLIGNYDVIYPDYENVTEEFVQSAWAYNVELDGVMIENIWPLDQSTREHEAAYSSLPYFNENFETAFNHTLQWNSTRPNGEIYFHKHNEYAKNFINAVNFASGGIPAWSSSPGLKGDIMINRQNITTSWTNLRNELVEAALGGVSGHWFWSSPICGDTDNYNDVTQIQLCIKWYMAATYMPMIKIHSKSIPRHPLAFNGTDRILVVTALNRRLSMLPYFYTTLQEGPLLRPMFYQFPSSESLADIKTQFSVGNDLLIVPNLTPSQSHVHAWLPPGTWYEFWSGFKLEGDEGEAVTMTTTDADFLTLIRGGAIIAMQKDVSETAEQTRLHSNFSLTIAIGCYYVNITDEYNTGIEEKVCEAKGYIYMTKNMSIVLKSDEKELKITAIGDDYDSMCDENNKIWAHTINEINLYGLEEEHNNYDHKKHMTTFIDLCELTDNEHISISLT
ncbi:alpha-glucosidase 2 [Aphomia sociella]